MNSETRILIADDGKVIRRVLSKKLEDRGYMVTAASGGIEALEKLSSEEFDLVILDIHMPDLDGISVLLQIRTARTQIQLPVIMATAKDEDEDVVRCFEAGANDFVSKPINFPVLFARIDTQLKLKGAMEKLELLSGS